MPDPHLEVVVLRDGTRIIRRAGRASALIPRRGFVMADMATNQRRFAETLQLKERGEALKTLAAKPTRYAKAKLGQLARFVSHSRAWAFAKGVLAGAWSFVSRQGAKLGRVGIVATAVTVVTSERGQKVIGKVLGTTVRVVDTLAVGAVKAIGVIPFVGKPIAAALTKARHWVWDKALDATRKAKDSVIVKAAMHDGVVARNLRIVAAPYAAYRLAGLLPSGWKLVGYGVWAVWMFRTLANSPRIGGLIADVVVGTVKHETPKVDLDKTPASKAASPADQAKFDKFVAERISEGVAKADATVEKIDTALADNAAHEQAAADLDAAVMAHRTEVYENGKAAKAEANGYDVDTNSQADRDRQVKDELDGFADGVVDYVDPDAVADQDDRYKLGRLIAAATRKYFSEADDKSSSLAKRDQALKALLLPAFREALEDTKAADAAAYQYAKRQVRAYHKGEFPYDEGSTAGSPSFALKTVQIESALAEIAAKDKAAVSA